MKTSFAVALCGVAAALTLGVVRPAPAAEAQSSYLPNAGNKAQGTEMMSPWTGEEQDKTLTGTAPARTAVVPHQGADRLDAAARIVHQRTAPSEQEVLVIPETGVLIMPYSEGR